MTRRTRLLLLRRRLRQLRRAERHPVRRRGGLRPGRCWTRPGGTTPTSWASTAPRSRRCCKKAAGLDIAYAAARSTAIVWRQDLGYILGKYDLWSRWEPEVRGVMIAYASVYGNTENAANMLACRLAEQGRKGEDVRRVRDARPPMWCPTAFQYSHLVFAAPTYNGGRVRHHGRGCCGTSPPTACRTAALPCWKTAPGHRSPRPADGRPAGAPEGLAAGGGERDRPFRRPRAPAGGHRGPGRRPDCGYFRGKAVKNCGKRAKTSCIMPCRVVLYCGKSAQLQTFGRCRKVGRRAEEAGGTN